MSWFKQTLGSLKALLGALKKDMNDDNFRAFYAEVEAKLGILNEELKELSYLESNARDIRERVEGIRHSFENLLSQKDDIYQTSRKTKQFEIRRFSEALDQLSKSLREMRKRLNPFERAIFLIKEEEKEVEE